MKTFKEIIAIVAGLAVLLIVLVVFRFGNLFLKPVELDLERRAYKTSRQYVEARQTEMIRLVGMIEGIEAEIAKYRLANNEVYDEVTRSLENHRETLISRLKRNAEQIPADSVPRSAAPYID